MFGKREYPVCLGICLDAPHGIASVGCCPSNFVPNPPNPFLGPNPFLAVDAADTQPMSIVIAGELDVPLIDSKTRTD